VAANRGTYWDAYKRHRRATFPLTLAALVYAAGGVSCLPQVGWQLTLAVVVPVLLATLALVTHFVDDGPSKAFGVAVAVTITTWLIFASAISPWHMGMFWTWLVGTLLFTVLFATNGRLEQRIQMERVVEAWPGVARAIGEVGARMPKGAFKATASGWRATIDGSTADDLTRSVSTIEKLLRLKRGKLRVEATTDAHITHLIYEEREPYAGGVEFDRSKLIKSIKDPIFLGRQSDGKALWLNLWKDGWGGLHMLVAGATGAGKSSFLNLIIANVLSAVDAVPWLIDLKGGQEFGQWARSAGWLAVDKVGAVEMVETIYRIVGERGGLSRKLWRSKVWKPDAKHPVIVAIIDECAELTGDGDLTNSLNQLKSIARRARSVGVILIFATQYPTLEALGSSQIKGQLGVRVCFRTNKSGESKNILNNYDSVDTAAISVDTPGVGFIEIGDVPPTKWRVPYVSEGDTDSLDRLYDGEQPELDPDTRRVAGKTYAERERDPLGELDDLDEYDDGEDLDTDGEADGEPQVGDGEADGDNVGDDDDATGNPGRDYWRTLVVPEQADRSDDRMTGRPGGLGEDFNADEVFDEEFPPIANVSLRDLPKFDDEPAAAPKLDAEAAEDAFLTRLEQAVDEAVTPKQLAEASTLSRATVNRRIEELMEAGTVQRTGYGQYMFRGRARVHSVT
jgi:DNA segregation ATPase FtsK/SpoIIIE, S-DNA-T family